MSDSGLTACGFAVGLLIFSLLCCSLFSIGYKVGVESIQKEAIKTGHGEYNSQTAKFQWVSQ